MKMAVPLISCICVTKQKPELLWRAIQCFEAQTYPNKELVILYELEDLATAKFLNNTVLPAYVKIIIESSNPKQSLGCLRNIAIEKAKGRYICQWDDDDWYHQQRLEYQYYIITTTQFPGCIMTRWLLFNSHTGKAYLSDERLWEGSLVCEKRLFEQIGYADKAQGEDTKVVEFLMENKQLFPFDLRPYMYIYNFHKSNTCSLRHWDRLFCHSVELFEDQSSKICNILTNHVAVADGSSQLDDLFGLDAFEQPIGLFKKKK